MKEIVPQPPAMVRNESAENSKSLVPAKCGAVLRAVRPCAQPRLWQPPLGCRGQIDISTWAVESLCASLGHAPASHHGRVDRTIAQAGPYLQSLLPRRRRAVSRRRWSRLHRAGQMFLLATAAARPTRVCSSWRANSATTKGRFGNHHHNKLISWGAPSAAIAAAGTRERSKKDLSRWCLVSGAFLQRPCGDARDHFARSSGHS